MNNTKRKSCHFHDRIFALAEGKGFEPLWRCRLTVFKTAPLCPVAVPEIFCSLIARKISTAATPYCSLHPPQAALANVPTSVSLRMALRGEHTLYITSGRRCQGAAGGLRPPRNDGGRGRCAARSSSRAPGVFPQEGAAAPSLVVSRVGPRGGEIEIPSPGVLLFLPFSWTSKRKGKDGLPRPV